MKFSDFEKFLPTYLSKEANENLFNELNNFPKNIDGRLYTNYLNNNKCIYQGDGVFNLQAVNLPDSTIKEVPGMILSNTCDLDKSNERLLDTRLVFATIFQLDKYKELLLKLCVKTGKKTEKSINEHIKLIKKQYISHIFYLPKGANLQQDSIVLFDRVNNLPNSILKNQEISKQKIFTLSDYGFYLFLYKLSIHFTRIRENLTRNSS